MHKIKLNSWVYSDIIEIHYISLSTQEFNYEQSYNIRNPLAN